MMRLDKVLSDLGVATRKEIKQMIRSGRVEVDGVCVTLPEFKIDPETSMLRIDGNLHSYRRFRYFAMDKPTGVLTAARDRSQKTVLDILPDPLKGLGLFPVGRLDKDTSGLLLLTNDGEFAHQVISPKYAVEKRYFARTEGIPDEQDVRAFAEGLTLRDGFCCLPAVLEPCGDNSCYVTVMEGKYHQVRRMLAAVGKPVSELRRLSIGRLRLEDLTFQNGVCELCQQIKEDILLKNNQKLR